MTGDTRQRLALPGNTGAVVAALYHYGATVLSAAALSTAVAVVFAGPLAPGHMTYRIVRRLRHMHRLSL